MLQRIVAYPWFFVFLLTVLGLLTASAVLRVRRERREKHRAVSDRRKDHRADGERRWRQGM